MDFFRHSHKDKEEPGSYLLLQCPVCESELGFRMKKEIKTVSCKECRADFTFYPGLKKPIAQLHKPKAKQCNCLRCIDRRERKAKKKS